MEFPFPPAPPGYTSVLFARGLLVAWAVMGTGILVWRLRRWKFVPPREMLGWGIAAGISWFVVETGSCKYLGYDDNRWLIPIAAAAFSISAAGMAIGLAKIYVEGSAQERLYAVSIIGIATLVLGFLLLPSLGHPREASNRVQCNSYLKQMGLAMHNYHDTYGAFPPSTSGHGSASWRISILPFIDRRQLFNEYDRRKAWDDAANDNVSRQKVENLICPSNYSPRQDSNSRWFTAYSMLTGPNSMGGKPTGTSFKDITDGSSNTLLVVEACGTEIIWTEPRDVDTAQQSAGINRKGKKPGRSEGWLSSYHYGGAHALLADGTVRFLSADIDPIVLKRLSTIDQDDPFQ